MKKHWLTKLKWKARFVFLNLRWFLSPSRRLPSRMKLKLLASNLHCFLGVGRIFWDAWQGSCTGQVIIDFKNGASGWPTGGSNTGIYYNKFPLNSKGLRLTSLELTHTSRNDYASYDGNLFLKYASVTINLFPKTAKTKKLHKHAQKGLSAVEESLLDQVVHSINHRWTA